VDSEIRIDKWLWAVRLYKTRSLASQACRGGHVTIAGQTVKPSRDVHVGDVINARTGEILRTVRVTGLIDRRVGPKIAPNYMEDQTAAEEYLRVMKKKENGAAVPQRPKGAGRPTKKDRRQIEALERNALEDLP
jgi:ribosome-associated heat shock protein Hsp15